MSGIVTLTDLEFGDEWHVGLATLAQAVIQEREGGGSYIRGPYWMQLVRETPSEILDLEAAARKAHRETTPAPKDKPPAE